MTHNDENRNCGMHEALVSYLYSETNSEESRRVESHLNECAVCREEIAGFERVRGMLQQWQLDLPPVRFVASVRRSALEVIRELFTVLPLWAKGLGLAATAMLVLAVMGTHISAGRGGFTISMDMLGSNPGVVAGKDIEQVRAEMKAVINSMILESERRQQGELQARLARVESELQGMHSADLARLASSIQEQRARLKSLERDIDRREGLDLADILFSTTASDERGTGSQGGN
ncbi:MAG TPA: zf-HC2 domain-containing protein [Blastocatellia bacterium]|nr:zf-HC2 domain-containing protein [Blastocatellia bacterium]